MSSTTAAPVVRRFGALPVIVRGGGPAVPLVVLPGVSPEHAVPAGPVRWFELALVEQFTNRREAVWLGRRPGMAPGTTMSDVAADHADALRAAYGERPIDVLGVSTGGSIALQLAIDHPAVVRRLVIVSSAARLGEVRAPTLIVAGGRDRAYDQDEVTRTARAIPDCTLVRFQRRGHVTVASDPRFAMRVERFLRAPG